MKNLLIIGLGILTFSCSSIRVFSDFDNSVNFDNYKSFAFFKPGIEEVEISDLDKRRILKSIEQSLEEKNLVLSSNPDLLINISVKATDNFGRILTGTLSLTIFLYVLVNVGMVIGFLPVVGAPLPFMSYGGTSMVTLFATIGIIMSIKSHQRILRK